MATEPSPRFAEFQNSAPEFVANPQEEKIVSGVNNVAVVPGQEGLVLADDGGEVVSHEIDTITTIAPLYQEPKRGRRLCGVSLQIFVGLAIVALLAILGIILGVYFGTRPKHKYGIYIAFNLFRILHYTH
jgi:hypothetical protein